MRGSIMFAAGAEATTYLFEPLEVFHNRERHRAALGDLTPHDHYQQVTA